MRGKVTITFSGSPTTRITPAHAGKRLGFNCTLGDDEDHPRPCGEKKKGMWSAMLERGSPPPMRGKGVSDMLKAWYARITPAHAGKS